MLDNKQKKQMVDWTIENNNQEIIKHKKNIEILKWAFDRYVESNTIHLDFTLEDIKSFKKFQEAMKEQYEKNNKKRQIEIRVLQEMEKEGVA